MSTWQRLLEDTFGQEIRATRALSGGCVGTVARVDMADGRRFVAKIDESGAGQLSIEGKMLRYLAENTALPVPAVYHSTDELLVMDFVEGDGRGSVDGDEHAAELLAALHDHTAPHYGFAYDTLIGGLHQPNPETSTWIDFFAEQRLMHMGRMCVDAGKMPARTLGRIEQLCARLDRYIDQSGSPSLIHGDVWGGNVLFDGGRVAAFIDPAIYFADPEIELAFIGLFHTFGERFYARYDELRGIKPGFFEVRRDLYNLYPLLVHVRLFGGGYLGSVERIVERLR